MKRFIIISLAIVIILLLFKNADVYANIIKTVTDMFGKSFRSVTTADNFK